MECGGVIIWRAFVIIWGAGFESVHSELSWWSVYDVHAEMYRLYRVRSEAYEAKIGPARNSQLP